jgi:hypothetical protein
VTAVAPRDVQESCGVKLRQLSHLSASACLFRCVLICQLASAGLGWTREDHLQLQGCPLSGTQEADPTLEVGAGEECRFGSHHS